MTETYFLFVAAAAALTAALSLVQWALSRRSKGGASTVGKEWTMPLWRTPSTGKKDNEKGGKNGTVAAPPPATIPVPDPDPSLTPAALSTHVTRDHLFANKTVRHPYFQTMAHQPMQADHWIEPDHNYVSDLAYKKQLVDTQGKVVCDAMPCIYEACGELLVHLTQWLTVRYPSLFKYTDPEKKASVHNLATDTKLSMLDEQNQPLMGTEALKVVAQLVQDDFLIAFPSEKNDGSWICAGGLVCFPGFYLLSEKIGLSLHDTHAPVPQFNEKLLKSVERSLTRLTPDKPFERTSWEIVEPEDDLFWAPMAGPLPTKPGNNGAVPVPLRETHTKGRSEDACSTEDAGKLLLRLDHQTFVKMPKSGAVFFGVHPMRRPLSALAKQPLLPALLLKVHADSQKDLMDYKAAPLYGGSVIPYLETLNREQVESGMVKEEEVADCGKRFRERMQSV